MEFIENLKKILDEQGISKNKLAKEIGISEGTIRSWENGKFPTIDKLIKISQYFKISTDELLGMDNINLTIEERKIIDAYKKCNIRDKSLVDSILATYVTEKAEGTLPTSKIG